MSDPTPHEKFAAARLDALVIMQDAMKIPGIGDVERAQGTAAAFLCGVRLYRINQRDPDENDALAVRNDIEAIAKQCFDPLFKSIGDNLAENFSGVDVSAFDEAVWTAIEGNMTYECDKAGERVIEDREDNSQPHDPNDEHRTYDLERLAS